MGFIKKQGILIVGLLFLSYSVCRAQIRVAIVAGPQSSSVNETNSHPDWNDVKNNYHSRFGFHGGFLADIPFSAKSKLSFQPGINFSMKGRKYAQNFDSSDFMARARLDSSQFLNYIEIPLNVVLKFPLGRKAKFIIGAGPYVAFFFNGKEKSETSYINGDFAGTENKDLPVGNGAGKYKTLDYGVGGLAGFEIGRVFITANYSRGLADFWKDPENLSVYNGHFKHQVIGATLGVFFGKQPKVEVKTKVKDKDQDGVADKDDACPTEVGTAMTKGCPDKDGDGVADAQDKCPTVAGLLKYDGCGIPDTDGDGVNDELDKCPAVAGLQKYNGCPIPDTDGDGINDEEDKCPRQAGVLKYSGCPIPDTDGDGVNDEEDKCPQTKGSKENNGCPVIKKEVIEKINLAARQIQFEYTKATIQTVSFKVLDDVVKVLNQDASLTVSIEGHTSNDGILDANMRLSQARADNVKNYFISKGISASRLKAKGFGPNKPLNAGKTDAEKAKNRRVELKLGNR